MMGLSRRRCSILMRSLCCAPHDKTLLVEFPAPSVYAGAIVHILLSMPRGFCPFKVKRFGHPSARI